VQAALGAIPLSFAIPGGQEILSEAVLADRRIINISANRRNTQSGTQSFEGEQAMAHG